MSVWHLKYRSIPLSLQKKKNTYIILALSINLAPSNIHIANMKWELLSFVKVGDA